MIVVCGVDNTGKTTLVSHLANKFGLTILQRYHTLPPVDANDWIEWLKETMRTADSHTIADRFFVDEFVYGPVIRNKLHFRSESEAEYLKEMFYHSNPLIILCDLSTDLILRNFKERRQMDGVESMIERLQMKFYAVLSTPPLWDIPQHIFNFTEDPTYKGVDTAVENYLKEMEELHK